MSVTEVITIAPVDKLIVDLDGRALPKLHDMQQPDQFSAAVPPLGDRSFIIENRSTS